MFHRFSGWWLSPTPLKNMSPSIGMMKFHSQLNGIQSQIHAQKNANIKHHDVHHYEYITMNTSSHYTYHPNRFLPRKNWLDLKKVYVSPLQGRALSSVGLQVLQEIL